MATSMDVLSTTKLDIKSSHVSDSNIDPFLRPDFDPADYLNSTLPSLSTSTTTRSAQGSQYARPVQLPELASQLQTVLSQLNAQTSRLSNALTQLTDEIIRSGGRLAYEVEVLRGETIGLTDLLEGGLKGDIETFTPSTINPAIPTEPEADIGALETSNPTTSPENHLTHLKTLTTVRARLDSVIRVFGSAMQWPLAPSETSLTSSLISVSAPSANENDIRSREEKGKAYISALQAEIAELIGPDGNDAGGIEAALGRVEELRQLAEVWKGTSEEKARMKVVENLQKAVEERQKASVGRRPAPSPARGVDYRYGNVDSVRPAAGEGGYGFLQNLRNLKQDVYLE